jgi:hypothetical protein
VSPGSPERLFSPPKRNKERRMIGSRMMRRNVVGLPVGMLAGIVMGS